jgi:hypothetical protein
MNDIKQALKDSIKAHQQELAKLEKALTALEGTKPAPKAKAANGAASTKSGSARNTTDGTAAGAPATGPLPDRIIAELEGRDEQAADSIAQGLKAPLPQVRSTCSRLVREGRIGVRKIGRESIYLSLKSEQAEKSPFEGEAN